jgi:hypothetical protein
VRSLGGKGTAADIRANNGGAAGEEGKRGKAGQSEKSLSCGLNRTPCTGASSEKPDALGPSDPERRRGYPIKLQAHSTRSVSEQLGAPRSRNPPS